MPNVSQVGGTTDDVFISRAENAAVLAEEAQAAAEAAQAAAEAALAATQAALAAQTLDDHADVSVPAPSDGQVLTFDSGSGNSVADDLPPGSDDSQLSQLSDVDTSGASDGDLFAFDSGAGEWQPLDPASLPLLPLAGGTMTGAIVLPGAPTTPLQAATKAYVDTRFVTVNPYDVAVFFDGVPGADADILRFVAGRAFFFPLTLPNSAAHARVAATAAYSLDIRRNGVSIGSIDWAVGANAATFTFASNQQFTAGDRLSIVAPSTPDATLEDIGITLAGTIGTI
jgi:hypothetical protein